MTALASEITWAEPFPTEPIPTTLLAHLYAVDVIPQYGVPEVELVYDTLSRLRPDIVCEWGTHMGHSARLFYEIAAQLMLGCRVHSIDITKDAAGGHRGAMVKNVPVNLHVGDGVTVAMGLCERFSRPLFFLDDNHEYRHVLRQLETIHQRKPGVMLMHDVFRMETVAGEAAWILHEPGDAAAVFLAEHPHRYAVEVVYGPDTSSMLRLWPRLP